MRCDLCPEYSYCERDVGSSGECCNRCPEFDSCPDKEEIDKPTQEEDYEL